MLQITRRAGLGAATAMAFGAHHALARAPEGVVAVPIQIDQNRLWTGVWINGVGPFRFQITSSGNVFVVSSDLARRLKLPQEGDVRVAAHNSAQTRRLYRADNLLIGGQLPIQKARLLANDDEGFARIWQGVVPTPSDRVTAFDVAGGVMRYASDLPSDFTGGMKAPLLDYDNDLGWAAHLECRFAGRPVRLAVSVSNPAAVVLYPDAVKRLRLWDEPGPRIESQASLGGRPGLQRTVRRGDLEIGGLRFERPPTVLHDPKLVLADPGGVDGAIGLEVLRRTSFAFDPRRDAMWMRPSAAMAEPWTYDRAGYDLDHSNVRLVSRVHPGSPAERAGLRAGDRITAGPGPNGREGPPGAALKLAIDREGARSVVAIRLEDWL